MALARWRDTAFIAMHQQLPKTGHIYQTTVADSINPTIKAAAR
jgi:hypothetical protein